MLVHVPERVPPRDPGPDPRRRGGGGLRQGGAAARARGSPAGPAIDAAATDGRPARDRVPARDGGLASDLDFSMSGLKTAVLRYVQAERAGRACDRRARRRGELPGGDRRRAGDRRRSRRRARTGVSTVLLGGGVVANTRLRERLHADGAAAGLEVLVPAARRCAPTTPRWSRASGRPGWLAGERTSLDIAADPNLPLAP